MTPKKAVPSEDEEDEGDVDQLERSWEKARGFSPRMVQSEKALEALREDLRMALTPKKQEAKGSGVRHEKAPEVRLTPVE